jgi:hypothetical protein
MKINNLIYLGLIFNLINNQDVIAQNIDKDVGALGFARPEQKFQVSTYEVMGNQKSFDGKQVFLKGYIKFEYDELNFYPEKCSCIDSFYANRFAIKVTVDEFKENKKKFKECDRVYIFGTYIKTNTYGKDLIQNLKIGNIDGDIKIFE